MAKRICPVCKKEKENVGPKLVSKGQSDDPRLASPNDVINSAIMCEDCYNEIRKNKI